MGRGEAWLKLLGKPQKQFQDLEMRKIKAVIFGIALMFLTKQKRGRCEESCVKV